MAIVRWTANPLTQNSFLSEFDRLRSQMQHLFDTASGWEVGRRPTRSGVFPMMNVSGDADNLYVTAELPGVAHVAEEGREQPDADAGVERSHESYGDRPVMRIKGQSSRLTPFMELACAHTDSTSAGTMLLIWNSLRTRHKRGPVLVPAPA